MDNSNKAIAKRLTELEKIVRNLLADAPWKQHEKSVPSQHQTHDEQNEMESVSPILSERDPTTVHTNDPKAKWYNSLEWWKAHPFEWWKGRLEIVALLAGVGYAGVTYFQWRDLRNNFGAEQRSWVKISSQPTRMVAGQDAFATLTLTNVGKSTVKTLYAEGVLEFVDSKSSPSFSLRQRHSTHSEILLFPTDHSDFTVFLFDDKTKQRKPLTAAQAQGMQDGKIYSAVFGWVIYSDQFGPHWYRFCNWSGAVSAPTESTADAGECVAWNRIGDGKPDVPVE